MNCSINPSGPGLSSGDFGGVKMPCLEPLRDETVLRKKNVPIYIRYKRSKTIRTNTSLFFLFPLTEFRGLGVLINGPDVQVQIRKSPVPMVENQGLTIN